ncbi:hypothetical protein N9424_03685 [Gammaproteobacteria bacterium]|nr:hypothetical protein [Gammaproteobacteria bacterium]
MNYKILLTLALSFQINGVELPAYEARYSYESDEINIEGIRKFSKDPNSFNLSFKAKNLLASMGFESIFLIENSQIISKNYVIKVRPKFVNRDQEIAFNYVDKIISSFGRDAWEKPLDQAKKSADPMNAQIQIRLNLSMGMQEFTIKLLEIKNGGIEDNFYKVIKNEPCSLGENSYECVILKRFREKENRETLYYLIPDLDYMFLKIIDRGPERNQKLELLEILSLG